MVSSCTWATKRRKGRDWLGFSIICYRQSGICPSLGVAITLFELLGANLTACLQYLPGSMSDLFQILQDWLLLDKLSPSNFTFFLSLLFQPLQTPILYILLWFLSIPPLSDTACLWPSHIAFQPPDTFYWQVQILSAEYHPSVALMIILRITPLSCSRVYW